MPNQEWDSHTGLVGALVNNDTENCANVGKTKEGEKGKCVWKVGYLVEGKDKDHRKD